MCVCAVCVCPGVTSLVFLVEMGSLLSPKASWPEELPEFPRLLGSIKACTVWLRLPSVLEVTIHEVKPWLRTLRLCSTMPNVEKDFGSVY